MQQLAALQKKYRAQRVVAELNGMKLVGELYARFPESWAVAQEVMFADASTILQYNANMRNLVVDKLSGCEMVVFNRVEPDADTMPLHKLARAANRRIDILYDYTDGTTSYDEIDLELPGKKKCAYFCIVSDQDSTFDFLSSLFFSFLFIRLIRYADSYCDGGVLPTKVKFVLDEFPNCCLIPDFTKKCSTIRSRGVSVACFFQNIGQMKNRYPDDEWQEILGACDTTIFLGCTDLC